MLGRGGTPPEWRQPKPFLFPNRGSSHTSITSHIIFHIVPGQAVRGHRSHPGQQSHQKSPPAPSLHVVVLTPAPYWGRNAKTKTPHTKGLIYSTHKTKGTLSFNLTRAVHSVSQSAFLEGLHRSAYSLVSTLISTHLLLNSRVSTMTSEYTPRIKKLSTMTSECRAKSTTREKSTQEYTAYEDECSWLGYLWV